MPTMLLNTAPCPKPRMTRRDKWAERPAVMRYRAFCDELRSEVNGWEMPASGVWLMFYIEMPKSWSKRKRAKMDQHPHQQKPDIDNLVKAFLDALHVDDSHIHDIRASKTWSEVPGIQVQYGASHDA